MYRFWMIAILCWLNLGVVLAADPASLLMPKDAFQVRAELQPGPAVHLGWKLADGYYLYRSKFRWKVLTPPVEAGPPDLPAGEIKHDQFFGDMEIYRRSLEVDLPLKAPDGFQWPTLNGIDLEVTVQGCADVGVCFPPYKQVLHLTGPLAVADGRRTLTDVPAPPQGNPPASMNETDRIAQVLQAGHLWASLATFFGFGILLAFTPCVFPMIPILSGIIVGQAEGMTTRRAFLLSLCYVLAHACMYTTFGIIAGLFGSNLQADFQQPLILVSFSLLFVVLALSMFDCFTLQVPQSLQERLTGVSARQRSGSFVGAAVMGALSALIVGPCVAAPLAGALIYIGKTGDAVLGGMALFSLGLGMGLPLLVIGTSAGRWLPRAGGWMNGIKHVFGVGLLVVALWLLQRVLPGAWMMGLWGFLLIALGLGLRAFEPIPQVAGVSILAKRTLGVMLLVYGLLEVVGLSLGANDPLQPMAGIRLGGVGAGAAREGLAFRRIKSGADLDQVLQEAAASGRWVMLDFYADWCVACKEMERQTFTDSAVRAALQPAVLVQADVTANDEEDQALMKRFTLVGPPAILFFPPGAAEMVSQRVVGLQDAPTFLAGLRQLPGLIKSGS
ncbi:MAG: hypothetical protein RIQ52_358 [Pseudomonadota bacterium]